MWQVETGPVLFPVITEEASSFKYLPSFVHFNALEKLATQGEVMVFKHEGNWECLDHERDLVHLNKLWKEKKAPWKVW